jgi:hypothetical protein
VPPLKTTRPSLASTLKHQAGSLSGTTAHVPLPQSAGCRTDRAFSVVAGGRWAVCAQPDQSLLLIAMLSAFFGLLATLLASDRGCTK